MTSEELAKYEKCALDVQFCNWTHLRIIMRMMAQLFVSSRSKVTLFTALIEIGQLTKDTYAYKSQVATETTKYCRIVCTCNDTDDE